MSTSGQLNIKQLPKIDHKFCVVFEIRSLVIIKVKNLLKKKYVKMLTWALIITNDDILKIDISIGVFSFKSQ